MVITGHGSLDPSSNLYMALTSLFISRSDLPVQGPKAKLYPGSPPTKKTDNHVASSAMQVMWGPWAAVVRPDLDQGSLTVIHNIFN